MTPEIVSPTQGVKQQLFFPKDRKTLFFLNTTDKPFVNETLTHFLHSRLFQLKKNATLVNTDINTWPFSISNLKQNTL